MVKYIYISIAVMAGVLFGRLLFNDSVIAVTKAKIPDTVEEWIEFYAEEYQADAEELKKVAFCESGYRIAVKGDGGKAFSVFQFHRPTFERWAKELGKPLNYEDFTDHIELAAWAFSQGEKYKDDWVCWLKLYN